MMTELTAGDGHTLDCWMEPAQGRAKGGIVILQEIFGVTDQLKSVARRYAAKGYDVAIPALFDRQEKGAVIPFDEGPRGRDLMEADLSTKKIARKMGCTQRYLHKAFANENVTLHRFILNKRLDLSRQLIVQDPANKRTISEIAFSSGFNSSAHFCRAFKHRFIVTPKEMRQKN